MENIKKIIKSIIAENLFEEDKDGNYMSIQNLHTIKRNAEFLLSKLDKNSPVEDWIEDKISKSTESMRVLGDYFKHKEEELSQNELEEAYFILENSEKFEEIDENLLTEAEYKGRKVPLGKVIRGDVKKFKVYVKNDKGNVVKVNFGDPNMRIKKSNPKRRKSFRARHGCDENPGPRWKARYWSCKMW